MSPRMTWSDIKKTYPDQHVGLAEVEFGDHDEIKSAIVMYSENNTSKNHIFEQAIGGKVIQAYTSPDKILNLGAVSK